MRSLSALILIALHVALQCACAKELIMLEIEPITRVKRSSSADVERYARQAQQIPPEYLSLLQQLNAQRAAAAQQQPVIEQLLVARDGSKQPVAVRYILNPDGRIVPERLTHEAIQQNQYHQESYVQGPQIPVPTGQPAVSPELEAFSQLQTQTQQDYHDAPIRAQIAGQTERPNLIPTGGAVVGPDSGAPQIYPQAATQAREQARLREQFQNPAFAQLQADPAYYQQFARPQPTPLISVASSDTGRQLTPIYDLSQRQRVVYQATQAQLQPQPQSQPQAQLPYTPKQPATPTRRPIGASAQAQLAPSTQPQLVQENPGQFLVETSRPPPQPVRYVAQPQQQDDIYASLFGTAGRGLFSPATKTAKEPAIQTVRIPTPVNQRPLTRSELDALVSAGYSITPVGNGDPDAVPFPKAKRAPLPLTRRNHVVYQNEQDGVSYQYSPGSSEYNPKRYARNAKLYRADKPLTPLTYVIALQDQRQ